MSFRRLGQVRVGVCVSILCAGACLTMEEARAATPSKPTDSRRSVEFQKHLRTALHLYENLEYEQALEKLALARSHVRTQDQGSLRAIYEGIILADLNQRERALAAFRTGLQLKPDATLPLKVSPKVQQDFEQVREDVKRKLAQSKPHPLAASLIAAAIPSMAATVDSPHRPALATPAGTAVSLARPSGLAYALLGGGTAMAGTGAVLRLSALSFNDRRRQMTISEAVRARHTASTQLSVSTLLFGAGIAAFGTGAVLLFLPRIESGAAATQSKPTWGFTPLPGGFALTSSGRF